MNVIGLSAYCHESAACLLQDGRLVAVEMQPVFGEVFALRATTGGRPDARQALC